MSRRFAFLATLGSFLNAVFLPVILEKVGRWPPGLRPLDVFLVTVTALVLVGSGRGRGGEDSDPEDSW